MANIYDLAKIASGDQMGRVKEGAREAGALFAQYKHQKDIIKQINEAIADAKSKSKKGKLGSSILGSLLGMGAGALTGGITTPWLAKGLGALGAGVGAGIAEKYRRDTEKPTQKLKELKQKLKGRKQYEDVAATEEVFSDQLDAMMQGDVMSNILASLIMPVSREKVPGEAIMEDIPVKDSGDIMKAMDYKGGPGAPKGFSTDNIDIPGLRDMNLEPKLNYSADVLDEAIIPTKSFPKSIAEATLGKPSLSLNEEMLGGLVPGFDFEGVGSEFQGEKGQAFLKLLKYLGPSAYQELFKPKPLIDSYTQPQFRNPYRGGY